MKSNSFAYSLFSKEGVVGETLVSLLGYQIARESLQWLRLELRYGKNPTDKDAIASEIGNPQPSLYVHYDKDMRKVQRLNGYGSEESNPLL